MNKMCFCLKGLSPKKLIMNVNRQKDTLKKNGVFVDVQTYMYSVNFKGRRLVLLFFNFNEKQRLKYARDNFSCSRRREGPGSGDDRVTSSAHRLPQLIDFLLSRLPRSSLFKLLSTSVSGCRFVEILDVKGKGLITM